VFIYLSLSMRAKIAAKTLERWPEASSNRASVDNLLQQAAPFNHRQEKPVDVRLQECAK
jgi:hypothetical protein